MKRFVLCALGFAFACSHASSVRFNRGELLIADAPAMEATTQEPLYAQARPGMAQAIVYPGTQQDRLTRDDPRAITAFSLLRNGSECGDAFASDSAEVIWNRFTEAARRERGDLASFRKLVDSTLAKLGQETHLRGEYVVGTKRGVSYLRDSEWSNAPKGMVLELAFAPDSTSEISGLAVYRSETRPIVVKIGEAANAAR
jgi:hypothetical protein